MEELIEQLQKKNYQDSGQDYNGSTVYYVEVPGTDNVLEFWNDSNRGTIDCDNVCKEIAQVLINDGLDVEDNSVLDDWNTVVFEITGVY